MTTEADNIRLWASLRAIREPLLQRMRELTDEARRMTVAATSVTNYLKYRQASSAPSVIDEPKRMAVDVTSVSKYLKHPEASSAPSVIDKADDYIGQEWIVEVQQVAAELESQGFRDEAEFLKQQCQRQFGQPDFSASNELEAVRNLLAFIDSNDVSQSGELPVNTKVGNTNQRFDDEPDAATATNAPGRREQSLRWLANAMLLVRDHPDWSDAAIARKVGKASSTLSRSKEYKTAAEMARANKSSLHRGHVTVDSDSGLVEVEARDDDPHPDRGQPIEGSQYCREYCARCDEPIRVKRGQVDENPLCEDCRS